METQQPKHVSVPPDFIISKHAAQDIVDGTLTRLYDELVDYCGIEPGEDDMEYPSVEQVIEVLDNTVFPVRIEFYSNYDCLSSHHLTAYCGGYKVAEDYFGDMLANLEINPADMKKVLEGMGIKTQGKFPYKGGCSAAVDLHDLGVELANNPEAALFCILGYIDFKDIMQAGYTPLKGMIGRTVTIPAGNFCGLFNSWNGSGSLLDVKLKRDFPIKIGIDGVDGWSMTVDGCYGEYGIGKVYGVSDNDKEFWSKKLIIK